MYNATNTNLIVRNSESIINHSIDVLLKKCSKMGINDTCLREILTNKILGEQSIFFMIVNSQQFHPITVNCPFAFHILIYTIDIVCYKWFFIFVEIIATKSKIGFIVIEISQYGGITSICCINCTESRLCKVLPD